MAIEAHMRLPIFLANGTIFPICNRFRDIRNRNVYDTDLSL